MLHNSRSAGSSGTSANTALRTQGTRTGSLTAQIAVRFPALVSVFPLPYSPFNGSPIYTLGCWFGNAFLSAYFKDRMLPFSKL
jgi:hypothetical protein